MATCGLVALAPADALSLGPHVLYLFAHAGRGGGDSPSHARPPLSQHLPRALGTVETVALAAIRAARRLLVGALSHALTIPQGLRGTLGLSGTGKSERGGRWALMTT